MDEGCIMKRTRVEIDLNSLRPDGTTRVRLRNVEGGSLNHGQIVTVFESEDNVAATAMVMSVDESRGVAFLNVNRASMQNDDDTLGAFNGTASNRALARVANQRAEAASTSNHGYSVAKMTRESF